MSTAKMRQRGRGCGGGAVVRERKLPYQQLFILSICRFADPIASTSLFPYLPEMVRSFGVEEDEVGKWAGMCSAIFSLCQAIMGIPWGRFSDRFGRRPAILIGTASTLIMTIVWGFSTNLPMAIAARGIAGGGSGNVGIIRTTVAEMVPFKELQPRAFSIMPLVWSVGSIFGPAFGGALANPYGVQPGEVIQNPNLLQRFPYALPNLVAACFFLLGIVTGVFFLEETLETKHTRDIGLRAGDKIMWAFRRYVLRLASALHLRKSRVKLGESEPLLRSTEAKTAYSATNEPRLPPPSFREVLNKQAVLNLVVYTLLALHSVGFDQLIPVFAHYPPIGSKVETNESGNFLKFAGGFGLSNGEIGILTTAYGVCGMLIQFFVFPPVARKFGVLNSLKACVCVYPIVYLMIPFAALLPTRASQVGTCFAIMVLKAFCAIFAIPCITILLTNSASSNRVLGTLNGFATTFSALGRAAGPALGGATFSLGVRNGYVIVPWWIFCAISIIAAVPAFYLVEGEGFGRDDGNVSDEEELTDDDQEHDVYNDENRRFLAESEAEAMGKPGPVLQPYRDQERLLEEQLEAAYGGMGPLAHSTTKTSFFSFATDDFTPKPHPHSTTMFEDCSPFTEPPVTADQSLSRVISESSTAGPSLSRRASRRVLRRVSLPIGAGQTGVGRRYSSNLGHSLGNDGH